jgi:hypothetical protein
VTTKHALSAKVETNFADDGGRSVGIVRSRTKATELLFNTLYTVYNLNYKLTTYKAEEKLYLGVGKPKG